MSLSEDDGLKATGEFSKTSDDFGVKDYDLDDETSSEVDHLPQGRQIGLFSAVMIIVNRMIGVGIFATPSTILSQAGSVGLSLILWVVGGLVAGSGLSVYLEFASVIPKNGGEKNYLEFVYRKPQLLATSMYAIYAALLGWPAGNAVVAGQYILVAAGRDITRWNQRGIGLGILTFAFLLHGTLLKWGLRIQNILGAFKIFVILFVVFSGFAALAGHIKVPEDEKPHNFRNAFDGTTSEAYGVVNALYNVIWSYIGYSNAFYSLSETKDPIRTIKRAAPASLVVVGILYILANIAYFAAIPKDVLLNSGNIVAAEFFLRMYGKRAQTAMSVFIALSAIGNVLAVLFAQGRLNQSLGREGALPFSKFFASNLPFKAPLAGLFLQYIVSVIIMLAPPPGDAYNFILNIIQYPLNWINLFVALGLVFLYIRPNFYPDWKPKIRATFPLAAFFLLSNLFLIIAPVVPPKNGENVYKNLPYWIHVVVGIGVLLAGAVYWLFFIVILPRIGHYKVVRTQITLSDGTTMSHIEKVPL